MANCCELLIAEHRRTEERLQELTRLFEQAREADVSEREVIWADIGLVFDTLVQELYRHYALEEQALFPILSQYRTMMLMEVEHDDLLALQDEVLQAISEVLPSSWEMTQAERVFLLFRDRLMAHMQEEERGIFPLAEERLEPEEAMQVVRLLMTLLEQHQTEPLMLKRFVPSFSVQKAQLFQPLTKPMQYQTLYNREHTVLQSIGLKAGQKQAVHWAGQHQCLLVLSGEVAFESGEAIHSLMPGDVLTLDSRLPFSLFAIADAQVLALKVWPHPHYTKGESG